MIRSQKLFLSGIFFIFAALAGRLSADDFVAERTIQRGGDIPDSIFQAMNHVWLFKERHFDWTEYEKTMLHQTKGVDAKIPPRIRMGHKRNMPSEKMMEITYFDELSPSGVGRLYLHLNQRPPEEEIIYGTEKGPDQHRIQKISFAGVEFYFSSTEDEKRIIYLGDRPGTKELENRLRLSVIDNGVLSPWLRHSDQKMKTSFGDPDELPLSIPQRKALEFLKDSRQGRKSFQAAIQLLTGMGKTEVAFSFFEWLRQQKSQKPRMVWIVNGLELVDQTYLRFIRHFPSLAARTFKWDGKTVQSREAQLNLADGNFDHLFISTDSLATEPNQALFEKWVSSSAAPLFVVADELHGLGADGRMDTLQWLKGRVSKNIEGLVGLSATPYHYLEGAMAEHFGNNIHHALLKKDEIDPITHLPNIPPLVQMQRAMREGYSPILLPYPIYDEKFGRRDEDEGVLYSREDLETLDKILRRFHTKGLKAMIFHSPGKSNEFGHSSRAHQFQVHQQSQGLRDSAFMRSQMENLDGITQWFRTTKSGYLNLVKLGIQGVDFPDVNLILLAARYQSPVLVMQLLGRGLRLAKKKVFLPFVDLPGAGYDILFEGLDRYFSMQPVVETAVEEILIEGEQYEWPLEMKRKLYKALGIDPIMIGADPESFKYFLNALTMRVLGSRNFTISRELLGELNLDLIRRGHVALQLENPERDESLISFFRRNKESFSRSGLLQPWPEVSSDIPAIFDFRRKVPTAFLSFAWNRAFKEDLQKQHSKREEAWPLSSEMSREIDRLSAVHLLVSNHYLNILKEHVDATIFFVGRESDDFREILVKRILHEVPLRDQRGYLDRLRRLELNESVVTAPPNRMALSGLNENQLQDWLSRQGLSVDLVKSGRAYLFHPGPRADFLRPVLGILFDRSGLSARDFISKVPVTLLFSEGLGLKSSDKSNSGEILKHERSTVVRTIQENRTRFFEAARSQARRVVTLDFFSSDGLYLFDEFDWEAAIRALKGSSMTAETLMARLDDDSTRFLRARNHRVVWIQRFLRAQGLKIGSHLFYDLSPQVPDLVGLSNRSGKLNARHGPLKPRDDLHVEPRYAATRQNILCRRILSGI